MKFSELEARCEFVVDDAGNGWRINENQFAVVRRAGNDDFDNRSAFVVFLKEGKETVYAVNSYLDVWMDEEECMRLAADFHEESNRKYNLAYFTRGD